MKIEMKKYFILFIFLFNINAAFADPPAPEDPCPCCEELIDEDTGLPIPGQEVAYADCNNACLAGENPCAPIDSNILILFILGASLGIFKVYQNKKRQSEN